MSDLVTVGNYPDRISAELAKAVLDMGGIESYVSAGDMGGMRPASADRLRWGVADCAGRGCRAVGGVASGCFCPRR